MFIIILIDNTAKPAIDISFDIPSGSNKGKGVEVILRKGEGTEGFWEKVKGLV